LQVLGQRLAQMVVIDDQQPVEEFPAQGADDPLADRVRSGRLRRAAENPDSFRREHGVEGASELARAIPDQELDRGRALPEVHQDVAGRWVVQEPSGCAVMPARWTRRVPCSMTIRAQMRCRSTVSTRMKSTASTLRACAITKCCQRG